MCIYIHTFIYTHTYKHIYNPGHDMNIHAIDVAPGPETFHIHSPENRNGSPHPNPNQKFPRRTKTSSQAKADNGHELGLALVSRADVWCNIDYKSSPV